MLKKTYYTHLVNQIPNNVLMRFLIRQVNKAMKNADSQWHLVSRYRKPIKGQKYGNCGSLQRRYARRISLYLEERPCYTRDKRIELAGFQQ